MPAHHENHPHHPAAPTEAEHHHAHTIMSRTRIRALAAANFSIGVAGAAFGLDTHGSGQHTSGSTIAEALHNTGDAATYLSQGKTMQVEAAQAHEVATDNKEKREKNILRRRQVTNSILCLGAAASGLRAAHSLFEQHEATPSLMAGATILGSLALNAYVLYQPAKELQKRMREGGRRLLGSERDLVAHALQDTAHSVITTIGYTAHLLGATSKADQLLALGLSAWGVKTFWPSKRNLAHGHSHHHAHHAEERPVEPAAAGREVEKQTLLERFRQPIARRVGAIAAGAALLMTASAGGPERTEQATSQQSHQTVEIAPTKPETLIQKAKPKAQERSTPRVIAQPGDGLYDIFADLDIPTDRWGTTLTKSKHTLKKLGVIYMAPDGPRLTKTGPLPEVAVTRILQTQSN